MDDSAYGTDDRRGNWAPKAAISYGPAFQWPPRPAALFKWFFGFPGYLLPGNTLYAIGALVIWGYLTPPLEDMRSFEPGWVGLILLRNLVLAILVYSAWHLWLYVWRKQDTAFKYNRQWPRDSSTFLFGNQTYDNMFHTLVSGVPIWTAYEVLLLWAYANGYAPIISFADHPVWFIAMFFVVPFIHEVGFYFAHRLLHVSPLYELAHKLHHRNVNPGPWSGLSMHPIEHLFYFSCVFFNWIVPSSPFHAIFNLLHAGVSPALGHLGFHAIVVGGDRTVASDNYFHYLHHRLFTVNFGVEAFPLDWWFKTQHDGSPESLARIRGRTSA